MVKNYTVHFCATAMGSLFGGMNLCCGFVPYPAEGLTGRPVGGSSPPPPASFSNR